VKRHLIIAVLTLTITACSDNATKTQRPSTTISATSDTTATASDDLPGVESFTGLTQNHVDTAVSYPQSPPVGGDHSAIWQNCGIYDGPIANENAVHSMEHGAVWLAYRPDLAAADVELLRTLGRGHSHVLIAPYTGLTEPVVATAWGKQLRPTTFDSEQLTQFVAMYEQGPQTPEPGAPCDGKLGKPIE
jgi:hypothetical protein